MVSIKQKLKNSPGYFKKPPRTDELPPTPKKVKSTNMSIKKMLFKDLISAKYVAKDLSANAPKLENDSRSDIVSNVTISPQKEIENKSIGIGGFKSILKYSAKSKSNSKLCSTITSWEICCF